MMNELKMVNGHVKSEIPRSMVSYGVVFCFGSKVKPFELSKVRKYERKYCFTMVRVTMGYQYSEVKTTMC